MEIVEWLTDRIMAGVPDFRMDLLEILDFYRICWKSSNFIGFVGNLGFLKDLLEILDF